LAKKDEIRCRRLSATARRVEVATGDDFARLKAARGPIGLDANYRGRRLAHSRSSAVSSGVRDVVGHALLVMPDAVIHVPSTWQ
jgi:hypothetical protein